MEILVQLIFSGIAIGMIYAVIAFGYQLTFATSGTLNFGQGEALMLGALVGLTCVETFGINYWLMIPIVCIFGLLQGGLVEVVGVRPAIKIKSEFGWIMSTIALGIIFKNVAENLWGRDDMKFPSPIDDDPIKLLGANVLPMDLVVVAGALGMMLLQPSSHDVSRFLGQKACLNRDARCAQPGDALPICSWVRQRRTRRTASRRWKCWSIPSLVWKRSGASSQPGSSPGWPTSPVRISASCPSAVSVSGASRRPIRATRQPAVRNARAVT